jgi:peptidoglycan/xylan/chitin deacetylase (PgdA/CDA1 family)
MINDLLFSSLRSLDVKPLTVAFIPAYFNAEGKIKNPEKRFGDKLKRLVGEGSVIAMHGYTHEKRGLFEREFNPCSEESARNLLDLGEGIFEELGLAKPTTFVPPFWQTSNDALAVLAQRYETVPVKDGVFDFKNDLFHPALPVYDSPALFSGYALGNLVGNARTRINVKFNDNNPLVRIVLHAHDQYQLEDFGIVRKLVYRYQEEGRQLVTYPEAMRRLYQDQLAAVDNTQR